MAHTILLVEDNPDDVFLLRRAFGKANLANPLQVVGDGEEAVAYLSGHGLYGDRERFPMPVLVLLDLKLPKKCGLEVLEWVRQQQGLRRIPVVVLTSSGDLSDVNRAYDLGANSYLVKPGGLEPLIELMVRLGLYWIITNVPPEVPQNVS